MDSCATCGVNNINIKGSHVLWFGKFYHFLVVSFKEGKGSCAPSLLPVLMNRQLLSHQPFHWHLECSFINEGKRVLGETFSLTVTSSHLY